MYWNITVELYYLYYSVAWVFRDEPYGNEGFSSVIIRHLGVAKSIKSATAQTRLSHCHAFQNASPPAPQWSSANITGKGTSSL